jgi:hypothetical protein
MKHYDYIYSVVCFSGFYNSDEPRYANRLKDNIQRHLLFVQHYEYAKTKKICVILDQRGPGPAAARMLNELAYEVDAPNIDIHVLGHPNWGMTVGSMWDSFQWCKNNGISSDYWWTFDDDYICNHWKDREELLKTFNMIGQWEVMSWGDWNRDYYIKCWRLGYKIQVGHVDDGVLECLDRLGAKPEHRCWTDGGYYMMKFSDLLELEKQAGCFMKVPNNEDGTKNIITADNDGYGRHGIMYGEVGFPTMMKSRGMTFCAFSGESYLTKRWDRIDLSQCTSKGLSLEWNNPNLNQFYRDLPDDRGPLCLVKVPPLTGIRTFLLQNMHLEPPNFPYQHPEKPTPPRISGQKPVQANQQRRKRR